jgi:hypothetical protein
MRAAAWFAICCGLLAPAAQAQVYKCVDERGVVHYSDKPRAGCKGGPVGIQPIPPLSGQASKPPSPSLSQDDADFRRRQIDRERQESYEKAAQMERARVAFLQRPRGEHQRCGRTRLHGRCHAPVTPGAAEAADARLPLRRRPAAKRLLESIARS